MLNNAFQDVRCSLADLVGKDYVRAVCAARAAVSGEDESALLALAMTPVDFFPQPFQQRLSAMLPRVGGQIISPASATASGATTTAFAAATHTAMSPVNGYGYFRVGEDGRLYLLTKSEHYHAPMGHSFPGYQLLDIARRLGIPNATHNNTRGHITRLLEEALVAAAGNGLDRVLNLETGSLAVEAALKMIFARFYRVQEDAAPPVSENIVPVILVMGNDDGSPQGNYHGTTMFTQMMRGMWPDLYIGMECEGQFAVLPIRPNHIEDVEAAFNYYDGHSAGKIAGFFHEIIMMNYGARRLTPEFLRAVYRLCAANDVPTVVDEIQSCMWAPEFFLFREWGLKPTFAAVGKGFPGGEYPASRLIFSGDLDTLPQFGALVTNGQEELASLAYLITMRWAVANADVTRAIGDTYEIRLREFAAHHPELMSGAEGYRHLSSLCFHELPAAKAFCATLTAMGLDISVQAYKANCPPVVLTKLPLIAGMDVVELVLEKMEAAVAHLSPQTLTSKGSGE